MVTKRTKLPAQPKTASEKRNRRSSCDFAFPVPKSLSISASEAAAARAYYTAYSAQRETADVEMRVFSAFPPAIAKGLGLRCLSSLPGTAYIIRSTGNR